MKGTSEEFVLKKRFQCYKKRPRKSLTGPSANKSAASAGGMEHILKPEEIVEIVKESLNLVFPQEEVVQFVQIEAAPEEVIESSQQHPSSSKRPRRNVNTRASAQYRNDAEYVDDSVEIEQVE